MRPSLAALLVATLAACEAGPVTRDLAVPDLAAMPDLAPPPPGACHDVACLPPACCGAQCQNDGQCCPGTICGGSGRCVPSACATCGDVGCAVDFTACTASCAKPVCCLATCMTDGDCCPATKCLPDATGALRCRPTACDACVGFRPSCVVSGQCDITCSPPSKCGQPCNLDGDCDAGGKCRLFLDGERLCVPAVFDATCNACGLRGCLFHPDTCSIECTPPPAADMSTPDDGGLDLSLPDDGAAGDAAPPPDLSTAATDLSCKACCTECAADAECCPGNTCQPDGQGKTKCAPKLCLGCSYGCRFFCP